MGEVSLGFVYAGEMSLSRRRACLRVAKLVSSSSLWGASTDVHVVFRSADGGVSWRRSDQGLPHDSRINAFGESGESWLAGTDSGIFVSRDGAASWQGSQAGARYRITAFATAGRSVFAGTDRAGLLQSNDSGWTWSAVTRFSGRQVRSLVAWQGRIYVGGNDGEIETTRDGQRWSSVRKGLPVPAQIFALSAVGGNLFAGLYSKGLYRWIAEEQRWAKVGRLSPLVLAAAGGTLLAGQNPGGLHWSDDLGVNWTPGTATSNGDPPAAAPVWAVSANDKLAVAGAATGIYLSKDRGRTWRRAHSGLPAECPGVSFLLRDQHVLAGSIIATGPRPPATRRTTPAPPP